MLFLGLWHLVLLGQMDLVFLFYQHYFDLVKNNLMILLHYFHSNTLEVAKLNHVMVILIPKEKETKKI
jgi:hypothetical protein